jgi:hypothetical protein
MKIGYKDIENIINRQLNQGVKISGVSKGKFAKDLAKQIYDFLEKELLDMNKNMKIEALARGIKQKDIDAREKIRKALGFDVMPLTAEAIEVYAWVMEQESKGQTIDAFAEWARKPERVQYINKYRKNVLAIKNEWLLAFESVGLGGYDEIRY